ncbi:MAG: hypothetical protein ABIY40_02035 [Rhodanobacteraceae bacterium]
MLRSGDAQPDFARYALQAALALDRGKLGVIPAKAGIQLPAIQRCRNWGIRVRRLSVLIVSLFCANIVFAKSQFEARVQRAKAIEESPHGKMYEGVLWKQIGSYTATVMHQCFPVGTTPDAPFFTLVGDVLPDSSLANVEVRPKTKMSECFADGFGRASFPKPPESFGKAGVPIEIDMKIKP